MFKGALTAFQQRTRAGKLAPRRTVRRRMEAMDDYPPLRPHESACQQAALESAGPRHRPAGSLDHLAPGQGRKFPGAGTAVRKHGRLGLGRGRGIRDRLPGVTTHAQQQRMLAAILSVGVTVIEARTFLLVSNPSDAVSRLPSAVRDLIRRTPVVWQDAMGNLRNTVRYELFDEDVG